ncbi:MAG TPA: tRNA-intron lyase [Nitrososphaeraceae archaeon]
MSGCIGFSHNTRPEYVMGPFSGTLVESRIIIWDIEDSRSIFSLGYYGKPLGIYKPKGIDFETPLILDLIEGCYLVESRLLTVNNVSGKQIILKEMKEICRNQYVDFDIKYLVFKKLRDGGYIVSPGIKFGCDFAVYEHGPGIDHAPYLVQVVDNQQDITATGIVLAGRLATTVKKQFILAITSMKPRRVYFLSFDWWRA